MPTTWRGGSQRRRGPVQMARDVRALEQELQERPEREADRGAREPGGLGQHDHADDLRDHADDRGDGAHPGPVERVLRLRLDARDHGQRGGDEQDRERIAARARSPGRRCA